MRGRDWFELAGPLLRGMATLLRLLPRGVVAGSWPLLDLMPGLLGVGLRYACAYRLARRTGHNVMFGRGVEVRRWENLMLGNNVSVHKDCYLDATGGITVGNDCSIAHGSSLLSFEHTWADGSRLIRDNPIELAPVRISDDVWIGCGCRVLAGVTIGRHAIVAAGAVVVRDVEAGTIVGGVPARHLKNL